MRTTVIAKRRVATAQLALPVTTPVRSTIVRAAGSLACNEVVTAVPVDFAPGVCALAFGVRGPDGKWMG